MLKKIIVIFLVLLQGVSTPAFADTTVSIPGFTEISYPAAVKFGSSNCKTIKFTYVNDENLAQENSVFLIQILHKTKKINQGFGAWFSTMTANPSSIEIGPLPRAGVLPIKICKKKWTTGSGANKSTMAATPPGTYRLYFAAGFVDAVTGAPLDGKIEIFKTIKVS
jgi:hypothetical protein